ncbi:unnamed protein product [Caretta caretta]
MVGERGQFHHIRKDVGVSNPMLQLHRHLEIIFIFLEKQQQLAISSYCKAGAEWTSKLMEGEDLHHVGDGGERSFSRLSRGRPGPVTGRRARRGRNLLHLNLIQSC